MTPTTLKVAIIGGGPGAMFFCHSYNRQTMEAQAKGQKLSHQLDITCFECHAQPGGIWRKIVPENLEMTESVANLAAYEELWTNGPSHTFEFYDYTFDEHFDGVPVPVYLPRKDITEYLIQRVTKNSPTFFDDNFQFHTEVIRVEEIAAKEDNNTSFAKLQVTTRNLITGEISMSMFDKCIWAAGENSLAYIPESVRSIFAASALAAAAKTGLTTTTDNETTISDEKKQQDDHSEIIQPSSTQVKVDPVGSMKHSHLRLLHSTESHLIRRHIQQTSSSQVLILGGGLSAEDLTLQCLKWGADHVHVAARDEDAEVFWTEQWPGDRVTLHKEYAVHSVETEKRDGSIPTTMIQLEEVEFVWPCGYRPCIDNDEDDFVTLRGIDLVIFCTGYKANLSMLDEPLTPTRGNFPLYSGTLDDPSLRLDTDPDFNWNEWIMSKIHPEQVYTGNVPAAQGRMVRANYNPPDMHRGILFRNPNMMFLYEHGFEAPLLALDVYAWLFCSYLTGRKVMPTVPELEEANRQQVLDQMDLPFTRYMMDEGYCQAVDETMLGEEGLDDEDYEKYMVRLVARVMKEGDYPGTSLGTYERLNKNGLAMMRFQQAEYFMRAELRSNIPDEEYIDEAIQWRTFRDDVEEVDEIYSLYTGTQARPLKIRWMDAVGPHHSVKNGI